MAVMIRRPLFNEVSLTIGRCLHLSNSDSRSVTKKVAQLAHYFDDVCDPYPVPKSSLPPPPQPCRFCAAPRSLEAMC
jgi:beta-phosphoglucomutase-like phosphatase (HAD superfamily)